MFPVYFQKRAFLNSIFIHKEPHRDHTIYQYLLILGAMVTRTIAQESAISFDMAGNDNKDCCPGICKRPSLTCNVVILF